MNLFTEAASADLFFYNTNAYQWVFNKKFSAMDIRS